MADQDDARTGPKSERVECKRDWWTTLLPAIAAVGGTLVGAWVAGREDRAAEQREVQADSYVKFLNVANTSDDVIAEYESCKGACTTQAAKATESGDAVAEALNLVFIYGSYDTYTAANETLVLLHGRITARGNGDPVAKAADRYIEVKTEYLRQACNDVNAVRQVC